MSDWIEELDALEKAAPCWPWESRKGKVWHHVRNGFGEYVMQNGEECNTRLAAAARNHLPRLLRVARVAKEITDLYYAPGSRLRIQLQLADRLRAALEGSDG